MTLTVSQLIEAVNASLDPLDQVEVEGEVDEFKIVHNKWVTFQIKDELSSVGCFMTVWQFKASLEDGMMVRAQGRPTLRNKGFFSFVLTSVQPTGEGALKRAFELLRKKLTEEGLFATDRKRALPRFPQHIALITSKEAAAYTDFLKVLSARHGGLTISFISTQVQGADAPRQLIEALNYANTELKDLDVIVMIRGGGSLEDLHAFNDETVIRTVAASRTPTIVGIGHERDITLAELAADLRASTPSNAAELLIKSREEISLAINNLRYALSAAVTQRIQRQSVLIARSVSILRTRVTATQQGVSRQLESLSALRQRILQTITGTQEIIVKSQTSLRQKTRESALHQRQRTDQLTRVLRSLSPETTLKRGYSITRNSRGKIVKAASELALGTAFTSTLATGTVRGKVIESDEQSSFEF